MTHHPSRDGATTRPGRAWRSRGIPHAAAAAAVVVLLAACGSSSSTHSATTAASTSLATHTIVDTSGRRVTLPTSITRIATTGAAPVINSVLFAFGRGGSIVNNLASDLQKPDFHFQYVFAPQLAHAPTIEQQIGTVNTEALAALRPQVVITDIPTEVKPLTAAGFKVVVLSWSNLAGLRKAVGIVGQIVGQPSRAESYDRYLDSAIAQVRHDLAALPDSQRPSVAYLQYTPLGVAAGSLGHDWLPLAGAVDATAATDASGNATYGAEQIVKLNPQVIITQARSDAYSFLHDPRFADVAAIKSHRVYVEPAGAQHWGNATSETPLVILWAARLLHPGLTRNINVTAATHAFYQRFYGANLTSSQIAQILHASFEGDKASS